MISRPRGAGTGWSLAIGALRSGSVTFERAASGSLPQALRPWEPPCSRICQRRNPVPVGPARPAPALDPADRTTLTRPAPRVAPARSEMPHAAASPTPRGQPPPKARVDIQHLTRIIFLYPVTRRYVMRSQIASVLIDPLPAGRPGSVRIAPDRRSRAGGRTLPSPSLDRWSSPALHARLRATGAAIHAIKSAETRWNGSPAGKDFG